MPDRNGAAVARWLGLGGLVVALDQITKWYVVQNLRFGEEIPVLPFFSWVRWHNEGAAFSLLSDAGGWQRWFFVALGVGFVAFIVYELRRLPAQHRGMGWVYGFIVGGAVGNLIDRALVGHVVDFVLLHYGDNYFPAFNVADMALTAGAGLWIGILFIDYLKERRQPSSP